MDALAEQRDPGEPPAGWNQALQAPIRCDEKGDPDAGIALEQPLQAPERSAAEVAAGVELVPRGCRMDVVDAEAHRCPLSGGQPRLMFDERHRGRGHGAFP